MQIHNWGIYYNNSVLIIAYVWLILEDFYLLSPSATKICAITVLGCLGGVLLMAGARTFYNIWFRYRGESLEVPKVDKDLPRNEQ